MSLVLELRLQRLQIGSNKMLKQYRLKNYHFQLVVYIIALSIIGILLIGSAKHSVQSKQIIGFVMGLTIMIVLSLIDYSFLLKFVWI